MKLKYGIDEKVPSWLRQRAGEMITRTVDLTNRYVHVTQLLQPVHMLRLTEAHWGELEVDPGDLIPALLGTAWHKYVEGAMPGGYSEHRIEVQHGEWTVIGTPDFYSKEVLIDHKTTRVWSKIFGKREWEEQLNVYRWLISVATGVNVPRLEIHAVYTDWTERGAQRTEGHPDQRWEVIPIPVWPLEDARAFVEAKLAALEAAEVPICTTEERWERNEHWAVMKQGRKTAMKRCDTAEQAATIAGGITGGYVEHRQGDPVRCRSWCNVRQFCSFGQSLEE